MKTKLWALSLSVMFALCSLPYDAAAQESYPSKPIRLIVPFAAGGASDIVARIVQPKLSESLGQTVVIDNRGGAAGIIGTSLAASAAPDGYTIVLVPSSHAINAVLYRNLPFDSVRSFSPVVLIDSGPLLLAVNPSLGVKSVKDLITLAKLKPGYLNYPSGGIGSGSHLTGALFASMAKVDIVHIPYKGLGPGLVDLVSGQLQIVFSPLLPVMPYVNSGRLIALAVTGSARLSAMPNVPTIAETIPGYEALSWHGILAPRGTPKKIVSRLNTAFRNVLDLPNVRKNLSDQGLEPGGGTSEALGARIKADITKFGKIITSLGIKPIPL